MSDGRLHKATPEYAAWCAAKTRCYNTKDPNYVRYGARGIKMCEEWREDFSAFLAHVGNRPSSDHSLDRINVNGNYEPGNCRWATWIEQCNNRRGTHRVMVNGTEYSLAELSRASGIKIGTLWSRWKNGRPLQP